MDCPTCGRNFASERGVRQHHAMVHDRSLPNRTCADCGAEFYDPEEAHRLSNVVILCRSCHRRVEEGSLPVPTPATEG